MQNRKRDTDVQNSLLDSVGKGEGGMFQENSMETCILSRVKQITSPGWMHETSARTWCTGKTQRERVEREVGGGIGMGNTCKPMAVSFQCMTKSTTNKKKIIIKKKRKGIEKKNDGYSDLSEVVPHCSFKPISYFCYCIYFPYLGLHIHKITSNFSLFSMILKIIHVVVWIGRLLVFITGQYSTI